MKLETVGQIGELKPSAKSCDLEILEICRSLKPGQYGKFDPGKTSRHAIQDALHRLYDKKMIGRAKLKTLTTNGQLGFYIFMEE